MRSFRLSRVLDLRVKPETFRLRQGMSRVNNSQEVKVRFQNEISRWVRERQHYGFVSESSPQADGSVVMTFCVGRTAEIRPWILSWGAAAEVLSPTKLRDEIRNEMKKILEMLT
jgi:predicted DNA-binding transcriptional regulator YafY